MTRPPRIVVLQGNGLAGRLASIGRSLLTPSLAGLLVPASWPNTAQVVSKTASNTPGAMVMYGILYCRQPDEKPHGKLPFGLKYMPKSCRSVATIDFFTKELYCEECDKPLGYVIFQNWIDFDFHHEFWKT
jgi:hypothetical protein